MNIKLVVCLLVGGLLSVELLFGQEIGANYAYHMEHYTSENGLPQNSVKSMVMDEDGFLWLATEAGLVRFDGQRFETFDKLPLGMKNQRLLNIQLSLDSINKFYVCSEESDFIAIRNGKPIHSRYRETLKKVGKFETPIKYKFYISPGIPRMFRNIHIHDNFIIPRGGNGNYFKLDSGGVTQYRNWREELTFPHKGGNFRDYFRQGSQLFYCNENGRFSYFTSKGINLKIDLTGDILENKNFKPGRRNFQFFLNDIANQFFISLGSSVYLVSLDKQRKKLKTELLFTDFDCDKNDIITVYYDKSNRRLFLGSLTDGLFVITVKNFKTITLGQEVKNNVYYSQVNFDSNSVFVRPGAILGINEKVGTIISKNSANWLGDQSLELEERRISYIVDKKGCFWNAKQKVLLQYDRNGRNLERSWKFDSKIDNLYSLDGNEIWIVTSDAGLYQIAVEDGVINQVIKEEKSYSEVEFLQMDIENKKLWIGTQDGLYWINKETKKKERIKNFNGVHIRSIHFSSKDEVWIATYKHGFWLIKEKKVTRFPLDKNNYMRGIHCIVEDRNGFLWLPTNTGLYQVAKKELLRYHNSKSDKKNAPYYYYYSRESGFNTNEFNGGCQPCAVRTGNDYLSFPSMNGLVWFKPEKITRELPIGKIFIDDYRVNNIHYNVESDTIMLPIDPTSFELTVTTPFFGNKNNLAMNYVLSGPAANRDIRGDVDITGKKPVISFSHLPGGTYKLIIQLSNGSFEHPFTTKEIIVISPLHFYETAWFRVLLFLLTGAFVLFLSWLRTTQIKRRNERLEQIVLQRTEELQNTLSVLRNSGDDLQNKINQQSSIIASISHDINTPLQYHAVLINHGKALLENKNWEELKDVYENLASSTSQIASFTGNLLEYIKLKNSHVHNNERVSVHAIVDKKIELFKPMGKLRNNKFSNEVDVQIHVNSNPILLGILIHNLIDNAYKFTYNGAILITSETQAGRGVIIAIHNSQGGMAPETISWLTSPTKEAPRSSVGTKKGLGLLIVKEISFVLDIKLHVISTENRTTVSLLFPDRQNLSAADEAY